MGADEGGDVAALAEFVAELPAERRHILAFVRRAAAATSPGTRLLDAGAGEGPYRVLFSHCAYVSSDWSSSPHPGARAADIISPLESLPVEDGAFGAVLCTQVLEHVERPEVVLAELFRVLEPGGALWLTAPMVGELHEDPFDFFRYTRHGLSSLAEAVGFADVEVEPLGGYFTALAVLLTNCGVSIGVGGVDKGDVPRRVLAAAFRGIGRALPPLDRIDERRALPVGWSCRALRPAA
jgi:SAM-dependent methyltransferase